MKKRLLPLFSLAILLTALLAPPVTGADKRIEIESFHADILVFRDGVIEVTETIRPRFTGQWNGLLRTIPVEYRSSSGFNYTLRLQLISITDESGKDLLYEVNRKRHLREFKIWVPGAHDATRTVRLRYKVSNGLRFFEQHDELYWNVTGDEWPFPLEASSASVTLPPEAEGVRATAFTGSFGSKETEADVATDGYKVEFHTRRPFGIREGLTIAVAWNKGAVNEPTLAQKIVAFLFSNWPFFFPLAVFGLMYWLWYTRGRDPRVRTIATKYEPPADLTPAEVGTLIDNSPDMRDITAIIVDLAVRGFLEIEEKEESKWLGLSTEKEFTFHLKKPSVEWTSLQEHERAVLMELFTGGARKMVDLAELENSFYKSLPAIKDGIFARLLERRYYDHRPDKVKQSYIIIGFLIGFFSVWGGGFLSAWFGISMLTMAVAGVGSALIIAGFGLIMPARTMAGTRALEEVLGFEEFLSRVEKHRLETMVKTPEMFEKYLPYAMALGVEGNWANAFADIYTEPPNWYRGGYYGAHFHLHGFTNGLNSMSTRAGTMMASSPRSSGGSGFGGGGGGGGGFGGGGGGGF